MFKNIIKRVGTHILIYLVIFYLVPYVSINFFNENIRDIITALFLVVFNLLIIISISTFDSYKYKLNWFSWIIPGLLFFPSINLFFGGMDLIIYSVLYCASYGIGMLLGWSYRTYGYQLKPKASTDDKVAKASNKKQAKSKKNSSTKKKNTK